MCTASIWHMCTMSMDRYFTLKYPMLYGRNKTKTTVAVKIIFVWVVSITISSPVCIYGIVDESYVFNDGLCVITIKEFIIYGSIFAFYVPLCIMLLTYMLTTRILWQNQNMMRTIDQSNFKMRKKSACKDCKMYNPVNLLSPPSSESRRDSHTDVSSLVRTPNIERVGAFTDNELKIMELKNVIDQAYVTGLYNETPELKPNEKDCSGKEICDKKSDTIYDNDSFTCSASNPTLTVPTVVNIQSPSDDDDEYSSLLPSTRSLNRSLTSSKFRNRTNTDVSTKSYLNTHSSLKIPKAYEKINLQASVSCSNFTNPSPEQDLLASLGLHNNALNRDYKSLEWCHHFYEIQEEMDQCLRESRYERRKQTKKDPVYKTGLPPISLKELGAQTSTETHDSGIVTCSKPDQLGTDTLENVDILESADSLDEADTSSENNSELLSIKLYPKSVYMYKLDIKNNKDCNKSEDSSLLNQNTARQRRGLLDTQSSVESDKTNEVNNRVVRKPSSIKRFIRRCKKNHGFKNFISSKTTCNEKKASKVLGIIFGVFVILWSPFFIANILSVTCDPCMKYISPQLMSAFLWMGYVASLANPIIYTMFNTAFRRAFIRILCCRLCTKGQNPRQSYSQHASLFNDRRQTLTVIMNGKQSGC